MSHALASSFRSEGVLVGCSCSFHGFAQLLGHCPGDQPPDHVTNDNAGLPPSGFARAVMGPCCTIRTTDCGTSPLQIFSPTLKNRLVAWGSLRRGRGVFRCHPGRSRRCTSSPRSEVATELRLVQIEWSDGHMGRDCVRQRIPNKGRSP